MSEYEYVSLMIKKFQPCLSTMDVETFHKQLALQIPAALHGYMELSRLIFESL